MSSDRTLRWCAKHEEPAWVYHDGSVACWYDSIVEANNHHQIVNLPQDDEITRLQTALGYISSPTMGLPGGADAATFCMDGATEQAARIALQCCIETARQALGGPS